MGTLRVLLQAYTVMGIMAYDDIHQQTRSTGSAEKGVFQFGGPHGHKSLRLRALWQCWFTSALDLTCPTQLGSLLPLNARQVQPQVLASVVASA